MPFTFVYRTAGIYVSLCYLCCERERRDINCSVHKFELHSSFLLIKVNLILRFNLKKASLVY